MRDLGAVSTGAVRGVVGSGGIDACTLGSVVWGRGCLCSVLVGVDDIVDIVRGGDVAGEGVLSGILCTLGSVAGGWSYLGCVC